MGLAISAASLATLRPLFKVIGWRLGFTSRPSGPSNGYPSARLASGNTRSRSTNADPFDNNVYVLSEFSQGTAPPELGAGDKLGTHSTAYTELGLRRPSDKDSHLQYANESQEKLHEHAIYGAGVINRTKR
jgi:hypothetical protein